jgi:hypothetical protein
LVSNLPLSVNNLPRHQVLLDSKPQLLQPLVNLNSRLQVHLDSLLASNLRHHPLDNRNSSREPMDRLHLHNNYLELLLHQPDLDSLLQVHFRLVKLLHNLNSSNSNNNHSPLPLVKLQQLQRRTLEHSLLARPQAQQLPLRAHFNLERVLAECLACP